MGIDSDRFVKALALVLSSVTCQICLNVLDKPTTICSEEHPFCADCLHGLPDCPTCRRPKMGEAKTCKGLTRIIGEYEIHCASRLAGCTWTGPLSSEPVHVNHCENRHVYCENYHAGCKTVVRFNELQTHLTTCPSQTIQCPRGCASSFLRSARGTHAWTCNRFACHNELCTTTGTREWLTRTHRPGCDAQTKKNADLQKDNKNLSAQLAFWISKASDIEKDLNKEKQQKKASPIFSNSPSPGRPVLRPRPKEIVKPPSPKFKLVSSKKRKVADLDGFVVLEDGSDEDADYLPPTAFKKRPSRGK